MCVKIYFFLSHNEKNVLFTPKIVYLFLLKMKELMLNKICFLDWNMWSFNIYIVLAFFHAWNAINLDQNCTKYNSNKLKVRNT